MANSDHVGYKKIQCWIPESLWDKIEPLNFPNQTSAVTEAFKALLDKSQENPNSSPDIPRLAATIQGLQLLLQEKDERISDLKRETETLSTFAHYFKSLEYRRLEASTEKQEMRTQGREEEPTSSPGEAHMVQEEREIVITQEPEEKPTRMPGKAQTGKREKALIEKKCKNCNQPFFTENPKKETCSSKCRSAYSRKKAVN